MTRLDPILALLLSPFVFSALVVLFVVLGFVFRWEATRRNPFSVSPDVATAREAAWKEAGL